MAKEFSIEDGKQFVALARKSIEYASAIGKLASEATEKKRFKEKRGCFVTLHTFPENELRGCIGFPYPVKPLWESVKEAAASAAFSDPRFPKMQANELEKIIVEVSVLSMPEEVKGEKDSVPAQIEVGKHGLIVSKGGRQGLLLPQVAKEYNWSQEEFLEHTCEKATLPHTAWRNADCHIFRFESQIFSEKDPNGEVEEL